MYRDRVLQQWDHWVGQTDLGQDMLALEVKSVKHFLDDKYGKHAIMLGVPSQLDFMQVTHHFSKHFVASYFPHEQFSNYLEADLYELPFLSGSIDLVLLPHILELVDNPRRLLSEVCRVIKPEGYVIILGFNPFSFSGLQRLFSKSTQPPFANAWLSPVELTKWLQLLEFKIVEQITYDYTWLFKHNLIHTALSFLEPLVGFCFPKFGNVYCLIAQAKVIPLTPIKVKWSQPIKKFQLPSAIRGRIAHHIK